MKPKHLYKLWTVALFPLIAYIELREYFEDTEWNGKEQPTRRT